MTSLSYRLRLAALAALAGPLCLFAPRVAHACVSSDMACSGRLPGDPCISRTGYGRCVSIGCAEMPASSCVADINVCDNAALLDPCTDKNSGDACSLPDGGAASGTCRPFTCADDGGTVLGCYVPLPADINAGGRTATGGSGSTPSPTSSADGTSSPAASDAGDGCAMTTHGAGVSSFVVIALGALVAVGRRRHARR